jgi:pimeloyl-ACP methyl ester carboxylesterase
MESPAPVVLVHGFWHGSWCWSLVTKHLAGQGIPSVAIDVDGQGLKNRSPRARWARPFDPDEFASEPSPMAEVTTSSAADTLVGQLRLIGGGRPCVVVAHSMGGAVATAAAERAPDLFQEIVYVAAFAPVDGKAPAHHLTLPEGEGNQLIQFIVADPVGIGAVRLDVANPELHARMREALYHDVDEVTADATIALLSTDAPAMVLGEAFPVTAQRYGAIPHTYVVCTEDKVLPVALQRLYVKKIDEVSVKPPTVVELATSHSPFLSAPEALADVIRAAAR